MREANDRISQNYVSLTYFVNEYPKSHACDLREKLFKHEKFNLFLLSFFSPVALRNVCVLFAFIRLSYYYIRISFGCSSHWISSETPEGCKIKSIFARCLFLL